MSRKEELRKIRAQARAIQSAKQTAQMALAAAEENRAASEERYADYQCALDRVRGELQHEKAQLLVVKASETLTHGERAGELKMVRDRLTALGLDDMAAEVEEALEDTLTLAADQGVMDLVGVRALPTFAYRRYRKARDQVVHQLELMELATQQVALAKETEAAAKWTMISINLDEKAALERLLLVQARPALAIVDLAAVVAGKSYPWAAEAWQADLLTNPDGSEVPLTARRQAYLALMMLLVTAPKMRVNRTLWKVGGKARVVVYRFARWVLFYDPATGVAVGALHITLDGLLDPEVGFWPAVLLATIAALGAVNGVRRLRTRRRRSR